MTDKPAKIKATKNKLEQIAHLARIKLSDSELANYLFEVQEILEYFKIIEEVDTLNVSPTYQVIDNLQNFTREDEVGTCLTQKQALSQAIKTYQGYFLVEGVLSEE